LATATVNGKIYAIGGYDSASSILSAVEEYDPVTNQWTGKAPMPTPRAQLTTAEIGGHIYAIGGVTDISSPATAVATVEEYRP
jgi:N-acetylneuraminic acid mutarotase